MRIHIGAVKVFGVCPVMEIDKIIGRRIEKGTLPVTLM